MTRLPPPVPSLVGRDRERTILQERLAAALAGQGGLVLIGGEAGIGKTALAEVVCREAAERDALVLVGRCYDLTETPPYGPWAELFGRYRQVGGLPPLPPAFAERGAIGAVTNQAELLQQARAFFTALAARRPTTLLLDDLHWADPASLDLLRVLCRDLADTPLLVLAAYRTDELAPDHPLAPLLPALVRESHAVHLELHRLAAADVGTFVAARYVLTDADRERLVAHLYEHAEGNPFFSEEMLHTLEEGRMLYSSGGRWHLGTIARAQVPPLVRHVIEGRLARLDHEQRRLLAVAAVLGQLVPPPLWAAVAGVTEGALIPAIERVTIAHLMHAAPDNTGMQFVHALIRETLYESAPMPMRRDWHGRAADILIASGSADPDLVASHLRRAGDARAPAWLVKAGERAYRAYAFITAAERFAAALRTINEQQINDPRERGWILYRLSVVNRFADPWHALAHLDEALRCADAAGDDVLRAYALSSRSNKHNLTGDMRRALADCAAAATIFDRLPEGVQPAVGLPGMWKMSKDSDAGPALYHAFAGAYAAAQEHLEQLVGKSLSNPAPEGDVGRDGMVAHTAAIIHAAYGRVQAARFAGDHAYYAMQGAGQLYPAVMVRLYELHSIILPYLTDRVAERRARTVMEEEAYRRVRDVHADPHPEFIRLPLRVIEGAWDEARVLALAWMGTRPVAWQRPFYAAAGALALAQGDRNMAQRLIVETFPDGPNVRPGAIWFDRGVAIQRLAASIALIEGDLPTALAWLEAYDRWLAWSGAVVGLAERALLWAMWHRASGDREQAYEGATRALAHASEPRQPLALIAAHRLLGELDTDRGDVSHATARLQTALDLADACAAPYERAQILYAQAALAHASDDCAAALAYLADTRAICTRLGAQPLLACADELMACIGARPPTSYPGGLTAREIDVLRLAAQGLGNPAIAGRLSISAHTVHRHMANIRTKLDLPSRTAAVAYAIRHDLL